MSESNQTRRKFLQTSLIGTGAAIVGAGLIAQSCDNARPKASKYMGGFAAPKLDKIGCAFIGVGARGSGHLEWVAKYSDAEILAIVDPHVPAIEKNMENLKALNVTNVKTYSNGDEDYLPYYDFHGFVKIMVMIGRHFSYDIDGLPRSNQTPIYFNVVVHILLL